MNQNLNIKTGNISGANVNIGGTQNFHPNKLVRFTLGDVNYVYSLPKNEPVSKYFLSPTHNCPFREGKYIYRLDYNLSEHDILFLADTNIPVGIVSGISNEYFYTED